MMRKHLIKIDERRKQRAKSKKKIHLDPHASICCKSEEGTLSLQLITSFARLHCQKERGYLPFHIKYN